MLESFMSCCQNKAFGDSPDAYKEALVLVDMLKRRGRNPWMDVTSGDSDYFHTEFSALKYCGYFVLFMTRGYARCIWNLREFYYAMLLNKSTFLIEVEMNQLDLELAGDWLLSQLRRIMKPRRFQCGQYHEIVEAIQEDKKKRGSDINFPLLKPDERKLVEDRLRDETIYIQDQFTILRSRLEKRLRETEYPRDSLARYINQFLRKKVLKSRSTFNKIFKTMDRYSSFINYRLVENVIQATEVPTDNLENYKGEFAKYASRRLYLSPSFTEAPLGDAEVVLKTDFHHRNDFYRDLDSLRGKIREIFKIEILRVLTVDEGCVKLVCAISHRIKRKVFPLSNEQKKALSKLRLLHLYCGEHQYTFKQVFYV